MQSYPDGGGYTLHHYPVEDDDYFCIDDFLYNNNAFPLQSMQTVPDQRVLPKHNMMRDYYYNNNNGSSMQKSPDQWIPLPKHSYNQIDGYGGYDQNSDNFKLGRENYSVRYPQHHNVWNNKNGYPVYDHYSGSMAHDSEMSGRYHSPINEQRPNYYEKNKKPSVWVARGIIDLNHRHL